MDKRVIILGAAGRFGQAAAGAFKNDGWQVTSVTRSAPSKAGSENEKCVVCNVMDRNALVEACIGQDVIVNAINPPYADWAALLPGITDNVLAAARVSGATVCIPGNVYVYGNPIPEVMRETTSHQGNTKKGRLRLEMEQSYRHQASKGIQTIILRGGDFIDGRDTGNWFESHITRSAAKGKITYPGPANINHAWAYLPDMARAIVELANIREELGTFEEFGFEGFTLTGADIARFAEQASGRKIRIAGFPWTAVRIMAMFSRNIREVMEMRYLWQQPHRIDGSKLRAHLSQFEPTPADVAIGKALARVSASRTALGISSDLTSGTSGPTRPNPAQ